MPEGSPRSRSTPLRRTGHSGPAWCIRAASSPRFGSRVRMSSAMGGFQTRPMAKHLKPYSARLPAWINPISRKDEGFTPPGIRKMPREYYGCAFLHEGAGQYLIWYSDDPDGVHLDAVGSVPTF